MKIELYGLQRSGTNYLQALFSNYGIELAEGYWKHGSVGQLETEKMRFEQHVYKRVFVCKNLFAWLVSIHRYMLKHRNQTATKDFGEFVRAAMYLNGRSHGKYRAANPIQYWNNANYHWSSRKMRFIRYEDIIGDVGYVRGVMNRFVANWGVAPVEEFVIPENIVGPEHLGVGVFDFGYYAEKRYMEAYTTEIIAFVLKEVDLKVAKSLGYMQLMKELL